MVHHKQLEKNVIQPANKKIIIKKKELFIIMYTNHTPNYKQLN